MHKRRYSNRLILSSSANLVAAVILLLFFLSAACPVIKEVEIRTEMDLVSYCSFIGAVEWVKAYDAFCHVTKMVCFYG